METRDSAKAPKVIGRYTLHGKIAQGGMAAVYFGRQLGAAGFSRTVAIKRLHAHLASEPDLVATILDEARMSARIHHPNVVPALDVVAEEGELLLVMEYVRGESLSRLLADEFSMDRSVPLPVASAVALDALQGLHAAHEATDEQGEPLGIVHRDVSPQNILVGADGVARIIDFGIAKAAGRIQSTGQGVIKGKWGYMAPEQVAGLEPSRAIDVYAMGVVLWELLAGRRLFWAAADAAIVAQVLEGPKRPPSHFASSVPPELDALVMRALSRDPADRFPTASDMADALVRAVPPALPKEVGVWVRGLAREALARRAAAVSEIESAFGAASRQPSSPSLARERPSHGGPAGLAARGGSERGARRGPHHRLASVHRLGGAVATGACPSPPREDRARGGSGGLGVERRPLRMAVVTGDRARDALASGFGATPRGAGGVGGTLRGAGSVGVAPRVARRDGSELVKRSGRHLPPFAREIGVSVAKRPASPRRTCPSRWHPCAGGRNGCAQGTADHAAPAADRAVFEPRLTR